MTGDSFDEQWPRYPSDASGTHKLMDLTADCDVDKLFTLQWDSSSEFLAKSQEVRGNKDFVATPWVGTSDEVENAAKTANTATPDQTLKPAEYEGKLRKTTCNSFGMGMKFQTFEIQRCIEAKEGQQYIMNTCVMTTATYGEKFRPCFKYTLSADGEKKSRLQVEYILVYVTSVNAFIKKAIERGASNGISKNFETVQEVLGDFVTVYEHGKEPAAAKPSGPAKKAELGDAAPKESVPQQPKGPHAPWWTGVMDRRFVGTFEPLAVWLKAQTSAGGTAVPRDGVSLTATGLALALMVISIYILRSTLHGIHAWLVSCTGISGWVFKSLFGWMDIPDSLCEVVLSFCLLVVTHTGLRQLVSILADELDLPEPPKAERGPDRVADDDGPDGTRYDGYDDAYNGATSTMTDEGSSSPSGSNRGQRVRHRDVWNQQIKESNERTKTQIKSGFKEFRRMMADGWKGHHERHEEKKEKKEKRRDNRHSRRGSDVSVESIDLEPSGHSSSSAAELRSTDPAASSSKSLSSASIMAPVPTPSGDHATTGPLSMPASATVHGTAADTPAVGTQSSKIVKGQHSPPAGTVTSVMTPLLEKTDHMLASWGLSRGNTMQAKPKEGALSPQSEAAAKGEDPAEASNSVTSAVTPILEKTDEYLASWGLGTAPGSPKTENEPAANAGTVVQASSPSTHQTSSPSVQQASSFTSQGRPAEETVAITADRHKTYDEADLAEMETAAGPVQEEIFENERYQPFKGWGHGWPGNFLPTDRVGHWSHRDGTPGKSASMAFSTVAPKVPKEWSWVEEGWIVDTQGIADDAVDIEGWSYARDFSGLRMPPAPGAGKFRKVRDFVRRRRWIRSRVKKPAEAQTGTSISSTASSPIFGQAAPIFASHLGADTQSTRSLNTDSRPNLSKVSTTSSVGTGPIFNRPSGMFATHAGPSGSVSFSGQMSSNSTGQDSPVKAYGVDGSGPSQPDMRGGSSHSLGGVLSGRSSGLEERPYMNLSDVKEGLSSQSRTWGNSVVSELHKAISSAGEDNGSLARDSMRSEDYMGNSPMSAGLQRLNAPSTAVHSGGGRTAASIPSSAAGSAQPSQQRLSPGFVRESTPQTLGTAGGIPVAPQLAQATGPATLSSVSTFPSKASGADSRPTGSAPQGMPLSADNRSIGNVPVQHSTAADFPAEEELTVDGSAPSAPVLLGQLRHGRLDMSNEVPVAAFPASTVAAGMSGVSADGSMMQQVDRDLGHARVGIPAQQSAPVGHLHAYEKSGVVFARPTDSSVPQ